MPLNPRPDDPIRAALRPFRVDPARFEAGVRARLDSPGFARDADPLVGLSPWLRAAAAFLPLPLIAGCRVSGRAATSTPTGGSFKIMSYLTFPAISLFVLLGATVGGVAGIRDIQGRNRPAGDDARAMDEAMLRWWREHRWGAYAVFGATLALPFFGATWLLFSFYIVSVGILLLVLGSLARRGLGDRHRVGLSCMIGLLMLWMVFSGQVVGDGDLHLVDPSLLGLVFGLGVALTCALGVNAPRRDLPVRWVLRQLFRYRSLALLAWLLPLPLVHLAPTLRPITPAQVRAEVESFDFAPYSTSSWRRWGIVAQWAVEAGLRPDMTRPRRLLNQPGEDGANPFVLGDALKAGLDLPDRPDVIEDYVDRRKSLLDDPRHTLESQAIMSLGQEEWVIRTAARDGSLTPAERDLLERRLHATMAYLKDRPYDVLADSLLVARMLAVIGRPVRPERYRDQVHAWLVAHHTQSGGGFRRAGGFRKYLNLPAGDVEETEYAIELMGIYGVPADIDLNWVRSFVRPAAWWNPERWMLAVARDRLDRLPGARRPTWWDYLYYERSLIAAIVLVGLCCYAVRTSPRRPESGSELVGRDDLAAGAGGDGAPGGEAD